METYPSPHAAVIEYSMSALLSPLPRTRLVYNENGSLNGFIVMV